MIVIEVYIDGVKQMGHNKFTSKELFRMVDTEVGNTLWLDEKQYFKQGQDHHYKPPIRTHIIRLTTYDLGLS